MAYNIIKPSGGDTGALLNLHKRLMFIQSHVDVQGKRIIDCGCGTGQYLQALLHNGAEMYMGSNMKVRRCLNLSENILILLRELIRVILKQWSSSLHHLI